MSATKPSILASAILPVENENGDGSRDLLVCIERSAASVDQMLAVELGLPSPAAFVTKELSSVKLSGQSGSLATLFAQASGFEPNTGDPLTMDLKRSSAGLELAVKARIGGGVTTVCIRISEQHLRRGTCHLTLFFAPRVLKWINTICDMYFC